MITNNKEGQFEINGVHITPQMLETIKYLQDSNNESLKYHIDSAKSILVYIVRRSIEDCEFDKYKNDVCSITQLIEYMKVFEV